MVEMRIQGNVDALANLGGGLLASAQYDSVKIWDVATGERVLTLETSGVKSLVEMGDGRLATGSNDDLKVWMPLDKFNFL